MLIGQNKVACTSPLALSSDLGSLLHRLKEWKTSNLGVPKVVGMQIAKNEVLITNARPSNWVASRAGPTCLPKQASMLLVTPLVNWDAIEMQLHFHPIVNVSPIDSFGRNSESKNSTQCQWLSSNMFPESPLIQSSNKLTYIQ